MDIISKYQDKLFLQNYEKLPLISGVELINGSVFNDDGGHFSEIMRLDDSGKVQGLASDFKVRQFSASFLSPGVIKAYHIHFNQDDLWFVPSSHKVLINLHDTRESSQTTDMHNRLVLGDGKNQILRIPQGVAHGASNPYLSPMILIYATNQQFNAQNPDEQRLPWDTFGENVWQLTKG